MNNRDVGWLVVCAVGAALIVLFAGAGVILAVGHSVPTEFWAAASSLSGALVGLLAPAPTTSGALRRRATQYHAMAALTAQDETAPAGRSASLAAMGDASALAAQAPNIKPYDLRIVLLSAVGVIAFVIGIVLAFHVGNHVPSSTTAYDSAVKNAADTLIALGSGAAGALIGLLAPTSHAQARTGF
ncbi:MAG: hypothetical protein M3N95_10935 [Actinomycetota bacterium]|nr:hypothetical protein [Actinomycetota bacterium]